MRELFQSYVQQIYIDLYATFVKFVTNRGIFIYQCYGDCCSDTWIDTLEGVNNLLGAEVNGMEVLPTLCVEGTRQDSDQVYGYKLRTEKGFFKLIFRNSSNGYYGGSLDLVEEDFTRSPLYHNIIWKEIKTDYCNGQQE